MRKVSKYPQFWVYPVNFQGDFSIFLRFLPRKGYKTLSFGKNSKNLREISSEYLRDQPKTEVIPIAGNKKLRLVQKCVILYFQ